MLSSQASARRDAPDSCNTGKAMEFGQAGIRSAIARLALVNDGKPIDIRFVDELPAVLTPTAARERAG